MTKHPCRVALGVTALATTILVSGCSLQPDVSSRVQPDSHVSQPAPALSGSSLTGSHINLATLRGHPVVVDFWASWCGPCRAEQAELNGLVARYAARGVQFIGIDIRDDAANARAYVEQYRVSYPSLFDPASEAAGLFNVLSPPTTIVIDSSETIRLRELGTLADVPAALDAMLGHA